MIEFADPVVFSIRRREDAETGDALEATNAPENDLNAENQEPRANEEQNQIQNVSDILDQNAPADAEDLASAAFSDLKLLVFVYKRVFREMQIQQIRISERAYYNTVRDRILALDDALAKDDVGFEPQPVRAGAEEGPVVPTQNDAFVSVLKGDVDGASFLRLGRDAVATLFDLVGSPLNNLLELGRRLARQVAADFGEFSEMRTIAVQPKLFVQLAAQLTPPDLWFELEHFHELLNLPLQ